MDQNKDYNGGSSSSSGETAAEFADGSLFMFRNVNSGLFMEVADANAANNANIQQWEANGEGSGGAAEWSTWKLVSAGNGYYYIYSCLAGGSTYVLDVAGRKADDGTNIDLYQSNSGDNQQFKFVKNSDGSYKILTKISGDKSAVEIENGSVEYGANVQQWTVNGYNCQDWQLIPAALPVNGIIARNLVVSDSENAADWSIAENASAGDKVYGDRDFTYGALPETLSGAERIVTACDSKNSTEDLASFTAGSDATVYVAIDSRVTAAPAWLGSYRNSGEQIVFNDGSADRTFDIYALDVSSGDKVILGTNGQVSGVMNYLVFLKEQEIIVTTTTVTTTETTTTTATTTEPVTDPVDPGEELMGDANCDGRVDLNDAVAILQNLALPQKYPFTPQGEQNADVVDNGISGISGNDALAIQMVDAGLVEQSEFPLTQDDLTARLKK
jgi:hypothetical protein